MKTAIQKKNCSITIDHKLPANVVKYSYLLTKIVFIFYKKENKYLFIQKK